jgi:hypothetical protein
MKIVLKYPLLICVILMTHYVSASSLVLTNNLGWSINGNQIISGAVILTNTGKDTLTIKNLRSNDAMGTMAWIPLNPITILPPGYSAIAEYKSSVISARYRGNADMFLAELAKDSSRKNNCFYIYADITQNLSDEKFALKYCLDPVKRIHPDNTKQSVFSKRQLSIESTERYGFIQTTLNDSVSLVKGILTITNTGTQNLSIGKIRFNTPVTANIDYVGAYDNPASDSMLLISPGTTVVMIYTARIRTKKNKPLGEQTINCSLHSNSSRKKHILQLKLNPENRTEFSVKK